MIHILFLRAILFSILITFTLLFGFVLNASAMPSNNKSMLKRYYEVKKQLFQHASGLPIYVESFDENKLLNGAVYSIVSHPFSNISNVLIEPSNWCDISLLHLNVKACTFEKNEHIQKITFYSGRKFYQPPERAFILEYQFQVVKNTSKYLKIIFTAKTGPMDTSDYRMELQAIPLKGKKTFMRFSYTYKYGLAAQTAMEVYFATLAKSKKGFSITHNGSNGDPVYIHGLRAAVERNSVRYYFAIQAYMDTLNIPIKNRFEKRINKWYDLTDILKEQLFEVTREDYIKDKRLELQNQLKLQNEITLNK
jgi:hypothetical protein